MDVAPAILIAMSDALSLRNYAPPIPKTQLLFRDSNQTLDDFADFSLRKSAHRRGSNVALSARA